MKTFWRVALTLVALVLTLGFTIFQVVDYVIPAMKEVFETQDPHPGSSGLMWVTTVASGLIAINMALIKNLIVPVSLRSGMNYITYSVFATLTSTLFFGSVIATTTAVQYQQWSPDVFTLFIARTSLLGLMIGVIVSVVLFFDSLREDFFANVLEGELTEEE